MDKQLITGFEDGDGCTVVPDSQRSCRWLSYIARQMVNQALEAEMLPTPRFLTHSGHILWAISQTILHQ